VTYAQRKAAPLTHVLLSFNAGMAADSPGARGLQNMTMSLLDEGTATRTAQQIAEDKERLGANLSSSSGIDRSTVSLSALTANLAPSLELMTDVIEHPAFADNDIERIRSQLLTSIAQARTDPNSMAARELPLVLYGPNHPYGGTQLGSPEAVKGFTRAQLLGFKDRWLRPDNAELFVVSDLPLAELKPQLEAAFANWHAPAAPRGTKTFGAPIAKPSGPRIVLIDRPGSPQSVIYGGELTPVDPTSEVTPFNAGVTVLGGSTASRINQDLREQKSWSYGAYGVPQVNEKAVPFLLIAPVQADRTGESVAELIQQVKGITSSNGVTGPELQQAVATQVGALPGEFETGSAVLGAMVQMAMLHRPDNYYEALPAKYRALNSATVDQAIRSAIDPNGFTFVVVGDAAKVRPQLDKLGIPIQVAEAP
jgi:predicted Zn-dependent peptidase